MQCVVAEMNIPEEKSKSACGKEIIFKKQFKKQTKEYG